MKPILDIQNLGFLYGSKRVLKNVSLKIWPNQVYALIGPSGCGKSTFLRCINRLNDLSPRATYEGRIFFHNQNILEPGLDLIQLRRKIIMVLQKPTPFPKSIFENIALGLKIHGYPKSEIPSRVERALKLTNLWEEVHHRLGQPAYELSGGQQQRLCIARAIALEPEILILDEPTASLDPISAQKIEELILKIKSHTTIIIVTHNLAQARRIADHVAFFFNGELIEAGTTQQIFQNPQHPLTQAYTQGQFG